MERQKPPSMTYMMIEDTIRTYIVQSANLTFPPADTDRLVDLGFIASMRLLDLVGFLEEKFQIRLRSRDLVPEKLASINQIAIMVRTRLTATNK
jgi:acyl carrier protein